MEYGGVGFKFVNIINCPIIMGRNVLECMLILMMRIDVDHANFQLMLNL